jgi:uncharacterized protein YegP (UPF0339 family)
VTPRIEFYRYNYYLKGHRREWRWRVRARNGKIIGASSEGYVRKRGAMANAQQLGRVLAQVQP